ncbi:MAG: ABC transporter ATP-binding protein [Actinobacteria bacterium]|nr:ABC transporter ATP-binding protein [Actinomycetota bacterium]
MTDVKTKAEDAAPTGADPLLSVSDLRIELAAGGDRIDLVSSAALSARRGEVVAVVGESGSGKSLTLRAIAGLLPVGIEVAGGRIDVDGIDVVGADAKTMRALRGGVVGMIFQEPMTALNPTMRIGAQIAEAARAHGKLSGGEAKARAIELLGQMGFTEPERRYRLYPHELSGGMRQRVVIAIALAGGPSLLLCDEPTTALDATVTMKVLDLIVGLASELDLGIVLVTHDLGVAARICDRIVVMYAGRVVEEGSPEELLQYPRHPYTLALLQAVPTRESTIEQLQAIRGTPPTAGEIPAGCPFRPRCAFAEPECAAPVELAEVTPGRVTACRRQAVLAALEERSLA